MDFIDIIPEEISELVFMLLPTVHDLVSASSVCKAWRDICEKDKIWQHVCKRLDLVKFGYGALDLLHLPQSDTLICRTNVSGTAPIFSIHDDHTFEALPKWKKVYVASQHLVSNWRNARYNVFSLKGHQSRVTALDSTGTAMVSGSCDKILIWDLDRVKIRYTINNHHQINSISIMGHKFLTAHNDGTIRLYDLISSRSLLTLHARKPAEIVKFVSSTTALAAYSDRTLKLWNLMEKSLVATLVGHTDDIECLRVYGHVCVTGSWDQNVILWDLARKEMLYALQGHSNAVTCLEKRASVLYSGSADETVRVWNTSTAECLHVLEGQTHEVYCLCVSDQFIAAAGSASIIAVWNTADYRLVYQLSKHIGVVRILTFSHGLLVSGGDRKIICIWDLKTGGLVNVIHRQPDNLHLMWVNETKIITASPNSPGSMTLINYW